MLVAVEGVGLVGQPQFFQQLLVALVEVIHPGRYFPRFWSAVKMYYLV
jgi:hypothetical protein